MSWMSWMSWREMSWHVYLVTYTFCPCYSFWCHKNPPFQKQEPFTSIALGKKRCGRRHIPTHISSLTFSLFNKKTCENQQAPKHLIPVWNVALPDSPNLKSCHPIVGSYSSLFYLSLLGCKATQPNGQIVGTLSLHWPYQTP